MSRRMEKQNVQGTGAPLGLRSTQCEYTDCVVFSNAWFAKFSQYSTTDWFSNSYDSTHALAPRPYRFKASQNVPHRCTCVFRRAPRVPSP